MECEIGLTMSEDLTKLTVAALRELARKRLGKGFSRLKTKADLVRALTDVVASGEAPTAKPAGRSPPPPAGRAPAPAAPAAAAVRVSSPPVASSAPSPKTQRADVVSFPHRRAAEPLVEGFFVARVAGEAEASRHHLTEESHSGRPPQSPPPPPPWDERLGELPELYEDDAALLLPRDPHTLFFLWDFAPSTRAAAFEGLRQARARLRVYEGEAVVRELDFALESRSFYIHGLPPGRTYRVEACFVGENGESRRIGPSSNAIELPREGPSSDLTVRFLRVPWDLPLSRLRELWREFQREPSRLAAPARVRLPSSETSRALATPPERVETPHLARPDVGSWAPTPSGRP